MNKIIKEDLDLFKSEIAYNIGFGAALISICYSAKNKNNNEIYNKQLKHFIKRVLKSVECLKKVDEQLNQVNISLEKKEDV